MFEEKESFWKKKGFYLSACAAILCVLAIGTLYYKINHQGNNGTNLFADSATTSPNDATSNVAGGSAINDADNADDNSDNEDAVSVVQNNTPENSASAQPENFVADNNTNNNTTSSTVSDTDNNSVENDSSQKENTSQKHKPKKQIQTADASKTDTTTDEKNVTKKQDKISSDKIDKTDKSTKNTDEANKDDTDNTVATMKETGLKNSFDMEKGLLWPVTGDVILKYSMSNTIYFKTLAQYKCNPAIVISSKEGTNVKAAADGIVTKVTKSDEVGNVVTVDIGSGYLVTYGQLDNISVKEGQPVKEGSTIGKIAKPTKYYSEEGSNLYLQVTENEKPVDPMLLLR